MTNETAPVIFYGDFNATPGSAPTYKGMTSLWNDVWTQAGQGKGYTIPVIFPNRRIDFVWTSKGAAVRPTNARVLSTQASDHLPVVVDVALTNFAASNFYYPLNETSGSNIVDSINGLTGTLAANSPVRSSDTPTGQSGDRSPTSMELNASRFLIRCN